MSLEENNYSHLEELSGSDFEIVDGEPNIIGWDVKNENGEKIGDVDDLLFDPQSLKVRYLVVDLDSDYLGINDDKTVLIPIGVAELYGTDVTDDNDAENESRGIYSTESLSERPSVSAEDQEYNSIKDNETGDDDLNGRGTYNSGNDDDEMVMVPNVTAAQLQELPVYEKGKLTPENESLIRKIFEGGGIAETGAGENFYDHEHFNENRFYTGGDKTAKLPVIEENLQVGKKEVETGGARITSRLVERPVEENITLKEEHVNVTRTPVNRVVTGSDVLFKPTEIESTEHAEVPVVSKEARVVEEVSLNKDVEEKEETVRDTVRNTEVEAEKIQGKGDETGRFGNTSSERV